MRMSGHIAEARDPLPSSAMTRPALTLALLVVLAPSALASAQTASAPATASSADYLAHVGRGLTASAAGDRAGAIEAFRAAVQLVPSRPEGICHLAEAQRASGDLAAALDGYEACVRVARAASDARWTARGLHGVASTLERMPERMQGARTAWQEYVRFADGAAAVASPAVGRARITAIDQVIELDRVMVDVRMRIAEREAQRTAPSAPSR
jgi:tetratricopeptide (TPR) repeat protein